jgi:lysophospholipase L1-like esterase
MITARHGNLGSRASSWSRIGRALGVLGTCALLAGVGCGEGTPSAGSSGGAGGSGGTTSGDAGGTTADAGAASGGRTATGDAGGDVGDGARGPTDGAASGGTGGVTSTGGHAAAGGGGDAGASPGSGGPGGREGQAGAGGARPGGTTGQGGGGAAGGRGGGAAVGGRGGAAGADAVGGRAGQGGAPATTGPFTIFIAGDSTVMTYVGSTIHQAGWGQYLQSHFDATVKVDNRAIGGRTSRRFIEEGRLKSLLDASRAGDYLLVQFGTNDSNKTAVYDDGEAYYLEAGTAFKTWMQQYADGANQRGVHPIFVTPPPRNSCQSNGTMFSYSFTAYATAMKDLGQAGMFPIVDLGQDTVSYLDAKKDCDWASANFYLIRADGTVDGTHFQENGASIMAGLLAADLAIAVPALAAHIK